MLLLALLTGGGDASAQSDERTTAPTEIENPYFETAEWKVWRDDPAPVEGIETLSGKEGAEEKQVIALALPGERLYPVEPGAAAEGRFLEMEVRDEASPHHAGVWDDVYASWSGLHGRVRPAWKDAAGNGASIKDRILQFVDTGHDDVLRAGVNFLHQSTTGVGHTIANHYDAQYTRAFERLYFSDCLMTAPAHLSFTDLDEDRSSDLYLALVPHLLNTVGSSNSETMAITKLILAGGYLPPETKRELKRHGLYPSALLYLWKAALPYDVPFDHELRHRVAYKAVGNRHEFPFHYNAAGIDKGDRCLEFHQYDDSEHMRRMVQWAESLEEAPPEACFGDVEVEGGTLRYALKKSALILQEPGQDVTVSVSTVPCYDIQGLPITTRWRLLYGTRDTRVEEADEGFTTVVTVPWDEALPEGRTALGLFAHNGIHDGNPAILTVYRQRGDLPPDGSGGGYRYPGTRPNRRPILLSAQDVAVRPGRTVEQAIRVVDPEGFPVRLYSRSGEPGTFDGTTWTWKCPPRQEEGVLPLTVIASDGTSGNSYAGAAIQVHVGRPDLLAQIALEPWFGAAPLTVTCSAEDSVSRSRAEHGWAFQKKGDSAELPAFEDQEHGRRTLHTFEEPGLYQITLTLRSKDGGDTETALVLVKEAGWQPRPAALTVSARGVRIRSGARDPSPFDDTDFGSAEASRPVTRVFHLDNEGDEPLRLPAKSVTLEGEHTRDFRVVRQPRRILEPRSSTTFEIRFAPRSSGEHSAAVRVEANAAEPVLFTISGRGR